MSSASLFNPRKMMERAVDVMRRSVAERRGDGKTSPLVGAVLVLPDGSVETAFRGEIREGDHAEYTLLERKKRDTPLDGSALFATLEPCAPGARKHPKLSCAERIVNARIKDVWVGIEDPDPAVDRKGLKYLQENGVTLHMFDADLQAEIRTTNKVFLAQAAKRATEARNAPVASVAASRWERPLPGADETDFSDVALFTFKNKLGRRANAGQFAQLLWRQGFLVKSGRKRVPSGFGYLLFAKSPRDLLPQAGLKGTIEYPDGKEEIRNFDGPAILIPDHVEHWLRDKLPFVSDRSRGMTRVESSEVPFELVREAVINALVHRDYSVEGATCHLIVTTDTITIRSPGPPPSPVTLEQLRAFNAPMLNRNPKLQFAFAGAQIAEGRGFGMKTFGEATTKHGLPLPRYAFDGVYLNLTIFRNAEATVRTLGKEVLQSLNRDELAAWKFLATRPTVTSPEMIDALKFDERKAQRVLKKLQGRGLLRRVGKGPATHYEVLR